MEILDIIKNMTIEEKAEMLTGVGDMNTLEIKKYNINSIHMADGPHGVRTEKSKNATSFPNLCLLGSTWDVTIAEKMGKALAIDCKEQKVQMLLGPGINIKRTPLCGRNFEYISEDPILSGELGAGYINGLQENGVSASIKHYAVNNQEKYRQEISVEIDERTLREVYLKPFEIAVKKSKPDSVMCSYNKICGVWNAENPFILKDVLKKEWNYEGMVISDWGAVQDTVKSLGAGLDYFMPNRETIASDIIQGIKNGEITEKQVDDALHRVLMLVLKERKTPNEKYNREEQHKIAKEIARSGMVLLKNDNNVLPITEKKYKKIGVIGEFAVNPLICGQGSAEVLNEECYIDNPLEELKKLMPNIDFEYKEIIKKAENPQNMLWPYLYGEEFNKFVSEKDLILIFAGSQESEDTEKMDKRAMNINPNYEMLIDMTYDINKNIAVIMQNGSAVCFDNWHKKVPGLIEMWLGGESSGGAIAEILTGKYNPSGKLSETFPTELRSDIDYPGDGLKVSYNEKFDVGYRYYDKHPEKIAYPFGFGLSYTSFEYSNLKVTGAGESFVLNIDIKNTGEYDGEETAELYISDIESTVFKPIKELKQFKKVYIKKGEMVNVEFELTENDFTYYNTMLKKWVVENGLYKIMICSSSQKIEKEAIIDYNGKQDYSHNKTSADMIG